MEMSKERLITHLTNWIAVSALPEQACVCRRRAQQLVQQLKQEGYVLEQRRVGRLKFVRLRPYSQTRKPYLTEAESVWLDQLLYTADPALRQVLEKVLFHA